MVSVAIHLLFAVVLGATLMSTPPKGTWQATLYDFECKVVDKLNIEEYVIGTTHLKFQTIDRGRLKYPKSQILELHGSIVGKDGEYVARHPIYDIETISESTCTQQLARVNKQKQ